MITVARVRELLSYDPESGIFRNKTARSRRVKAGEVAGHLRPTGYRVLRIDTEFYFAHRIAVLLATGFLPGEGMHVDHINGIKDDNSFANLRVVSPSVNGHNRKVLHKKNRTGFSGVFLLKSGRFQANCCIRNKRLYLGTFDTAEEASAIREAFRLKHNLI